MSDAWKEAVQDACVVAWNPFYPDDPKKTIDSLLETERDLALDPKVSSPAAKLHARIAELEAALKQIQTIMEPLAGNRSFMQIAGPARQTLNIIKNVL
jgi:hypothetical protein